MDTYRHFQSRPEERSDPFANAIFNCIVSKSGGVWLEFYHRSFVWVQMTDSKISIVQIMVWARTEERSWSESILTPPPPPSSAAYMRPWNESTLVQMIIWINAGILYPCEQTSVKFDRNKKIFHSWKRIWKCRLQNSDHLSTTYTGDYMLYKDVKY